MSVYRLTRPAERALTQLIANPEATSYTALHLHRAPHSLIARLDVERVDSTLVAGLRIGPSYNTLTLADTDPAKAQRLTAFIEGIANGTADTAQEAPMPAPVYVEHTLLPCRECNAAAIGFDYCAPGPGSHFLYGVQCRHNDCQRVMGCTSQTAAAARWNTLQSGHAAPTEQPLDMVNHPPHYNGHPSGIECIEVTELLPFNLGNAFKYVFRHRAKNGCEDLQKALWYLKREASHDANQACAGAPTPALKLAEQVALHEGYLQGNALMFIAGAVPRLAIDYVERLLAAA